MAPGKPLGAVQLAITVGVVMTIIPANNDFSAFSPHLAVFLLAVLIVPVVICWTGRPAAPSRRTPVWDGGIVVFKPRIHHSAMIFPALVRVNFDRLCQATVTLQRASDAVPALLVSPGHRRCATLRESGDAGPIRQRQLVPALCILGRLDGLPARRAWWPMMITCCAPTRSVGSVTGIRRRCRRIRQLFPAAGDGRTTRLAPTTRSGCRCDNRAAGVRLPGAVAATPRFLDVRGRPAKGRRFSYRHTNRRKNAI